MGEIPAEPTTLPASGMLLQLPDAPLLPLHVKAANDQTGVIVRLLNASDQAQTATIGSALLKIAAAQRCDLLENQLGELPVEAGAVSLEIPARRVAAVYLRVE